MLGLSLGVTQILALPTCWYPKCEIVTLGSKPTSGPNAIGFASQWNIGFRVNPPSNQGWLLGAGPGGSGSPTPFGGTPNFV